MKKIILFLIIILNNLIMADTPDNTIILQEEEVAEILASKELYAYFGQDVCPSMQDLLMVERQVGEQLSCQNLKILCSYITQRKTTAPARIIKAALEEVALCLESEKLVLSLEFIERLANNLDDYYTQFMEGRYDLGIAGEDTENITRSGGFTHCSALITKSSLCSLHVKRRILAGCLIVKGDTTIGGNLTVNGNELVKGDLTVLGTLNATITPIFPGNLELIGTPQASCIIFRDAALNEKARICTSAIPGDKGVYVSVDQGVTQNLRVNNEGGSVIAPPTSGAALNVTGNAGASTVIAIGNGTTTAPALTLLNNPPSAPTDVLLTINPAGVVTESTTPIDGGFLTNGCNPGPITIGSSDATSLTFVTQCIDRLSINPNGAVTIATPAAAEVGLTINGGGETITAGDLNIVAGNIILPAATPGSSTAASNGLIEFGGTNPSASNITMFEAATRNIFAGNYATVPAVTGTDNISVGTTTNSAITAANNTIAIGNAASAIATDSIAIGDTANTAAGRTIVIGSRDSTSTGVAPTAGAINAIAIGSASGANPGAVASTLSSIALGGADGATFGGAAATGARSIAVGINAASNAATSIAIGSASGTAGGIGAITRNTNAIAIGSANTNHPGAATGVTGLGSIAIGGADAVFNGASAGGNRTISIGVGPIANSDASVLIGSASGVAGGLGPNTVERTSIDIGSAQGALRAPNAGNTSTIAIGGSDGVFPGAVALGMRSIAIGLNATTVGTGALGAIAIGSASGNATGLPPTASAANSIGIGSAQAAQRGANATGTQAIALGGSDGVVPGAAAPNVRSVAVGCGATVAANDAVILGRAATTAVRVGIGNAAPTSKLHVVGANGTPVTTLNQVNALIGNAPVWLNPSTSAVAGTPIHRNAANQLFGFTSSQRYKKNIREITTESEVLYELNPVLYDPKDTHGDKKNIPGFIAEEVYAKAPHLAILNQNNQPENVAYSCLHALVIKEIQKHRQQLTKRNILINEQANTLHQLLVILNHLQAKIDQYGRSQPEINYMFKKLAV